MESQSEDTRGGLTARFKIGSGKAHAKREVKKQVKSLLDVHFVFPGSESSPDLARDYLARRNLDHDYRLRDLIEMRTGAHPVISYEMKLDGTRESEANFACGLELANAGPVKLLQIGATFTKTVQLVKQVEVTAEIRFPSVDSAGTS